MLKIKTVSFGGFKNVECFILDFSSENITALVSENNYGKSNVLQGLSFITQFIQASSVVKKQMMNDISIFPLNKNMSRRNFFAEILFDYTELDGKSYQALYSFEFQWQKDKNTPAKIITEKLSQRIDGKKQKFQTLINRDVNSCLYKASETGRCSTKIKESDYGLLVNRLAAFPDFYCEGLIAEINSIVFFTESHLDARFAFVASPFFPKGMSEFDLVTDDHQLAKQLNNLKTLDKSLFEELVNSFRSLFPSIESLDVTSSSVETKISQALEGMEDMPFMIDNNIYFVIYKDKNFVGPLNFEQMSDGAKRILLLLTNIVLAKKNKISIIAIEEPENSIHPKLLKDYIELIDSYKKEMRIIVTSHSPNLVSNLDITNIMVGLPNKDGLATFGKMENKKAFQNLSDKLSESYGECIFNLLNDGDDKIKEYWKWSDCD